MKKFINIVLVLAFVLLTLLLGGSTFIDRDINVSVTFPQTVTENELTQFNQYYDNPQLKVLYNLGDEAEYLLVVTEEKYEVYNRLSGKLLEMCESPDNPYEGIEKGYYLSPASYARGDLGMLVDIGRDKIVGVDTKSKMKTLQESIKEKNIDRIKNKLLKDKSFSTIMTCSVDLDLEDTGFDHSPAAIEDYTTLEHPELFVRWNKSNDFGNNAHGSCTAVAMTLLYKYADYTHGGIMPNIAPQNWLNVTNGVIVRGDDGSDNLTIQDNTSDKVGKSLHNYLVALSGVTEYGLTDEQMVRSFNRYNSEVNSLGCINLSVGKAEQVSQSRVYNFVRSGITSNIPSIITISSDSKKDTLHCVVAFGCRQITNDGTIDYFYRVHTGWAGHECYVINSDYIEIGETMYKLNCNSNSPHVLSYNVNETHACANPNCYSNGTVHRKYSADGTSHKCICGYSEDHELKSKAGGTSKQYFVDHEGYHYCEECGYHGKHTYENVSEIDKHKCSGCNKSESHDFMQVSKKHMCTKCFVTESCVASEWSYYDSDGSLLSGKHRGTCTRCQGTVYEEHSGTCVSQGYSGHSVQCASCNLTSECVPHDYKLVYYDAQKHIEECSLCGYRNRKTSHTYENVGLGLFFVKCSGCGDLKKR